MMFQLYFFREMNEFVQLEMIKVSEPTVIMVFLTMKKARITVETEKN